MYTQRLFKDCALGSVNDEMVDCISAAWPTSTGMLFHRSIYKCIVLSIRVIRGDFVPAIGQAKRCMYEG